MKRAIIILWVALMGTASAQQAILTKGTESKYVDADNLVNGTYVGPYQGLDCWVFTGKKHRKQVVLTDQNLMTISAVELPNSGHADLFAATVDGNRVAVLTAEQSSKNTTVLSYLVDVDSLAVVAMDTVDTFSYSRKDKCMLWAATSPNRQYNALVTIIQLTEKKQYRTQISLFDAGMRLLWEKEFALGSMHEMAVTDQGRIVTFGEERDEVESHFIFNIVDQTSANSYDVAVKCDPVKETHLVGVIGNHALAMGLFTPSETSHPERYTGGVFGMSFDIDSALLSGFIMHPFQNEDINILYNKKTKKVQRDQRIDRMRLFDVTLTSFGAVAAAGRTFETQYVEANGQIKRTFCSMGIHCMAIDTLGQLLWVRNIRRNDVQPGDGDLLRIALVNVHGDAALLKTESSKLPQTYDIAKEAKEFRMGSKGTQVLYRMAADGEVNKLVIEPKSKHSVLRGIVRPDGTLMILTSRGHKTRLAQLKFVE